MEFVIMSISALFMGSDIWSSLLRLSNRASYVVGALLGVLGGGVGGPHLSAPVLVVP